MANLGRPTSYKPEYCQEIIDHVGVQGHTIQSFASLINVHIDTIHEWAKVHPTFSEALRLAKNKAEGFWANWLENNLGNKNANAPLVKLYFANRFNWHDKSEVKQDIQAKVEISVETAEIKAIRESYEKDV